MISGTRETKTRVLLCKCKFKGEEKTRGLLSEEAESWQTTHYSNGISAFQWLVKAIPWWWWLFSDSDDDDADDDDYCPCTSVAREYFCSTPFAKLRTVLGFQMKLVFNFIWVVIAALILIAGTNLSCNQIAGTTREKFSTANIKTFPPMFHNEENCVNCVGSGGEL